MEGSWLVAERRSCCEELRTAHLAQRNTKDSMLKQESSGENGILGSNHSNEDAISDSESTSSSGSNSDKEGLFGSDFIRLDKDDKLYGTLEHRFLSDLARFGLNTQVVAIHRNACSSLTWQTKLKSFQLFQKAHEEMGKGNANLRHGWFTASKGEIATILSYGFVGTTNNGVYGRGIYLSPLEATLDSLQSSVADEDGMRHLVLCRVIMGRMEVIRPGSEQCCPSSEEYDSGVDDFWRPKKYIIWCSHMNTHIFPEFVIRFKAPPNATRDRKVSVPMKRPNSPWMPFSVLIRELSKFLPKDSIDLIQKLHKSFKDKKIPRNEIIGRFRAIAGDELLTRVIKSYRNEMYASRARSPKESPNERFKQHEGDSISSKNIILNK